jgi:phenylacetate-CoA ligase
MFSFSFNNKRNDEMSGLTIIKSYIQSRFHEKKSRETILHLQEKKFRNILCFSYKNSVFYKNLYKSQGISLSELKTIPIEKLPIVDKEVIMDNFEDVVTKKEITKENIMNFLDKNKDPRELYLNKYHVIHTSGSSGKIGVFIYSKKDWDYVFPYITRVFDFSFKKNKSVFFGAIDGHYLGVSFSSWLGKGITKLFSETLLLNITQPLDEQITKLNSFQPDILGGYFTGLKFLAKEKEKGMLHIQPSSIVNCGEGINPIDKKYIEKIYNVPLVNLYGLAECPILGVGRDIYDGIYLMDDLALIEINHDHVFLTNLYNTTQPLIRYKINDYLTKKHDDKKKLPFTLISDIVGRSESLIWLENNKGKMDFIHPIVIAEFYIYGLDKFQIIVKDKKSFDFLAVIDDKDKATIVIKIKKELDSILFKKNLSDINYKIKVVEDLFVDKKTGKFKLIMTNFN